MKIPDAKKTALNVAENLSDLDDQELYSVMFNAMQTVIDGETDKTMLALIASQLFELSERALGKSGFEIQPTPPTPLLN